MTSREKFEKWWAGPRVQDAIAERAFKNLAWDAWQASRDEEIELPAAWWVKQGPQELLAYEKQMMLDALRAAGFKVKGG